jgi:hypothetical protein
MINKYAIENMIIPPNIQKDSKLILRTCLNMKLPETKNIKKIANEIIVALNNNLIKSRC